jgi:protein-disulfide isomerase
MAKRRPPASKRQTPAADGSRRGLWITIAVVAAVAVIAGGALIFASQRSAESEGGADAGAVEAGSVTAPAEDLAIFEGLAQDGFVLGDPAAPVTITEFADLRCPACKLFADDYFAQVVEEQVVTGKAKFEFRLWPILGDDSVRAAQGAIAAAEQDRLFQFQKVWYDNQQDEGDDYATPEYVDGIAQGAGVPDLAAFQAARDDEALWGPAIQDVQVIAAQKGFSGTPAFLIVGPGGEKVLTGGVPTAEEIAQAVAEVS